MDLEEGQLDQASVTRDNGSVGTVQAKTGQARQSMRLEFANWFFDPNRSGTQEEWAREHGVAPSTLSDWKRHPEFRALIASWRETYRPEFVQVVDAMFRKAKAGDVQAARLLGDWLGENEPVKIEQIHSLADYVAQRMRRTQNAEPVVVPAVEDGEDRIR